MPIRELVNTLYSTTSKEIRNIQLALFNKNLINIETNSPTECLISWSPNSFREVSVISAGFSMDYVEYVQAQANNLSGIEQVENGEVHSLSLL